MIKKQNTCQIKNVEFKIQKEIMMEWIDIRNNEINID